jgi:aerobic carbon-monoxide dehydrogenase medium subunit
MKASNVEYVRPQSLTEACRILQQHDGEAVPLAGGQSLLAALNLRLSAPKLLVDIGDLPELKTSSFVSGDIRLGALTRHFELLTTDAIKDALPLLPLAAGFIGHAGIRNRGTLGGSLAFADPAAELPACAVVLEARIVVAGSDGEREVPAEQFFTGIMETALRPGELITAVRFPTVAPGTRYIVDEFSRRHGDFAVAGVVMAARIEDDRIARARVVYFGCVDRPQPALHVSAALAGYELTSPKIGAVISAVDQDLAPDDMPGWRAETKLRLARTLTRRAIVQLTGAGT